MRLVLPGATLRVSSCERELIYGPGGGGKGIAPSLVCAQTVSGSRLLAVSNTRRVEVVRDIIISPCLKVEVIIEIFQTNTTAIFTLLGPCPFLDGDTILLSRCGLINRSLLECELLLCYTFFLDRAISYRLR